MCIRDRAKTLLPEFAASDPPCSKKTAEGVERKDDCLRDEKREVHLCVRGIKVKQPQANRDQIKQRQWDKRQNLSQKQNQQFFRSTAFKNQKCRNTDVYKRQGE